MENGGLEVLAQMVHGRGAGNQQEIGGALQEPGEGNLHGRRLQCSGGCRQDRRVERREPAQREEWDVVDVLTGEFSGWAISPTSYELQPI